MTRPASRVPPDVAGGQPFNDSTDEHGLNGADPRYLHPPAESRCEDSTGQRFTVIRREGEAAVYFIRHVGVHPVVKAAPLGIARI